MRLRPSLIRVPVTTSPKWLLVTEEHPVVITCSLDFIHLESGMHPV
jgi:hypothetical protein